jgi:hypothetical protein
VLRKVATNLKAELQDIPSINDLKSEKLDLRNKLLAGAILTAYALCAVSAEPLKTGSVEQKESMAGKVDVSSLKTGSAEYKEFLAFVNTSCLIFDNMERQEISSKISTFEKSKYPIDKVVQTANCSPSKVGGGARVPMLQMAADDIGQKVEYPEVFFKYYKMKRKQPELFAEAINAKNTLGHTLLDYIAYLRETGAFATTAENNINRMVAFACAHGGVYLHYEKSCP